MIEKQFKVRDLRQKEKFVINDAYLDSYARILGVTASAVYMSLCRHADRNQECFPSQELIAREHYISSRSVKRAVKMLKEANMISIRKGKAGHGRWRNNVYVLLDRGQWESPGDIKAPWVRGQKRHQPGDNNDRTRGQESPTKDTHKKDTHIKDREKDFILSLNEEGEWMGLGNISSQVYESRSDDITGTEDTASSMFKERNPENVKRKLAEIKVELSERLGWENKDKR